MDLFPRVLFVLAVSALGCEMAQDDHDQEEVESRGGSAQEPSPLPQTGKFPDARAREAAEALLATAVTDASFLANESHGVVPPYDRAFGATLPFTPYASLATAQIAEAYMEERTFEPHCSKIDEDEGVTFCQELSCEEAGVLLARVWIEPLPLVTELGGEKATVHRFEHTTRFEDRAKEVSLSWTTSYQASLKDGRDASMNLRGTGVITPEDAPSAKIDIVLAGVAKDTLSASLTLGKAGLGGEGRIGNDQVLLARGERIEWLY